MDKYFTLTNNDNALLEYNNALKKAFELINNSYRILITTHINPDGDALGSAIALYFYTKDKGKNADIIISDNVPPFLKFLDGSELILKYDNIKDELKERNLYDIIILLDLNESSRIGDLITFVKGSESKKILIDHHVTHQRNNIETDITVTQETSSSTGEIIWDLINLDDNYIITSQVASALYTAIMSDTGSFRFPSTTPKVFNIASRLVAYGANPSYIYDSYYNINSFRKMKLYGLGLLSLEMHYNNRLCIMSLAQDDFIKTGAIEDDVENFVESLLSIEGVKVGILLTDYPGRFEIRISFRAKNSYEVRSLAVEFGGGGHMQASGARVKNANLDGLKNDIIMKAGKLFL